MELRCFAARLVGGRQDHPGRLDRQEHRRIFRFQPDICNASGKRVDGGKLRVLTISTDTIMGVTFCAVAPEYSLTTFYPHRGVQIIRWAITLLIYFRVRYLRSGGNDWSRPSRLSIP